MSEFVTYAKAKFFRKPNFSESFRKPNFSGSRICPKTECTEFRSLDWTHHMIIVKWHLLIWHKRKLCALTNRPPAQSTRTGQWLSTLFHANCSAAQVYVLHPWKLFFALSCRRRSVLQVFLFTKKDILKKFFVYVMMTNFMGKTCLNKERIKISNLIEVKN